MTIKNIKNQAGQIANTPEMFGPFNRYSIYAIHTRFDAIQWIVRDGENYNASTGAEIIRQANTKEEAMDGLEDY